MKAHGWLNESAGFAVKGGMQIATPLCGWLDECGDDSDELPAWPADLEYFAGGLKGQDSGGACRTRRGQHR